MAKPDTVCLVIHHTFSATGHNRWDNFIGVFKTKQGAKAFVESRVNMSEWHKWVDWADASFLHNLSSNDQYKVEEVELRE